MAKRNTDTVPAMLTPGEFVIKKESAQKIGYDKLKQMNKTGKVNTKKEAKMPQGKGTYGSQKGRPPKKAKGYQEGGKALPKALKHIAKKRKAAGQTWHPEFGWQDKSKKTNVKEKYSRAMQDRSKKDTKKKDKKHPLDVINTKTGERTPFKKTVAGKAWKAGKEVVGALGEAVSEFPLTKPIAKFVKGEDILVPEGGVKGQKSSSSKKRKKKAKKMQLGGRVPGAAPLSPTRPGAGIKGPGARPMGGMRAPDPRFGLDNRDDVEFDEDSLRPGPGASRAMRGGVRGYSEGGKVTSEGYPVHGQSGKYKVGK